MSTNDPGTSDRSPDQGTALADDRGSAAMFALPDPLVIARLANEFFAALPSNAAVPENVGASAPGRATAGDVPAASSFVPAPAGGTAFTPPIPSVPESPAAPGSLAYFLDRTSPLNATATLPSLNEAFAFQAVPGAQPLPGIPGMPVSAPAAPLSETDLQAIPSSLGNVPSFATGIPPVPSQPAGSSAYFLDFEKVAPLTTAPSFPDVAGMFSFPGVPGLQSIPGVPGLPSSPPTDLAALPDVVSAPAVPGASAFVPGPEKAPATAVPPLNIGSFEFHPNLVPEVAISTRPFDPQFIRRDFPILQEQVNGRPLVWLDNAATTQKPNAVIDRVSYFYRHENSNIHRAAHTLAARATDAYEGAREKVRRFLNAPSTREIVFVRGATEGLSLIHI